MKIEILPEDLDKAVEATKQAKAWSTHYCLLAQVGIRLFGGPVADCAYRSVTMQSGACLYVNGAWDAVQTFDFAVSQIKNTGKIDETAIANLRAALPITLEQI